ncbi:MAG: hypothetical protein VKK80_16130 [Prochlorothrix sp.]|nr:hypothetical protein [Prochlorothrix sp.]
MLTVTVLTVTVLTVIYLKTLLKTRATQPPAAFTAVTTAVTSDPALRPSPIACYCYYFGSCFAPQPDRQP